MTSAQGNKVRKTLLNSNNEQINTTYYVYDALGTLLAIYKKEGRYGQISLIEAPINAPGRIGMWRFGQGEKLHDNYPLPLNPLYTRTVNKKLYELTDQTGNVRVVITDRKRVNGSDEAKPDIAMSAQYYPYGMAQAGRVASAGADYRYGYNGMEEEDRGDAVSSEIASTGEKVKPGEANLLNTEFRLYDPRLGQWLTPDPVFQPWESPYSAMAGNPILFSDPQGLDAGSAEFPNLPQNSDFGNPNEHNSGGTYNADGICSPTTSESQTPTEEVVVTPTPFEVPTSVRNYNTVSSVPNVLRNLGIDKQSDQGKESLVRSQINPEYGSDNQDEVSPPGLGHYIEGTEEFGERGGKLKVSTTPLKTTGKIKYYENAWGGNKYIVTKYVFWTSPQKV